MNAANKAQKALREEAYKIVSIRSFPALLLLFFLFISLVLVTPLQKYAADLFKIGTYGIVTLLLLRSLVSFMQVKNESARLLKINLLLLHLTGLGMGLFMASVLVQFELGWTSFYAILITVLMASIHLAALSPALLHLTLFELALLAPSIYVNLTMVPGLQGLALGIFFSAILLLIFLVGRVQCRQYWLLANNKAQVDAILEALPGTLSCINAQGNYTKVNKELANLLHLTPVDFIGKKVGFIK